MSRKTAICPTRALDYPAWYQQVVQAADLAENSPTRGCMIIKPWGYALWESIQKELDSRLKERGVSNAYFPLLIPKSFLEKEARHVRGFSKECAVVTHARLEEKANGKLEPSGQLAEPYIIRPTSELIIGDAFSRWVSSYRDLPLKINQWANVVRWEMRTRLFLRTSEFLWQEGHTAHAKSEEALEESWNIIELYARFCGEHLALPVIIGEKTEAERFPGAEKSLCVEAMMQDGKALQVGTSHFLGQNFSKACQIQFLNEKGSHLHAWTTSWGVSTRLIGGLIMTHSDDDGLVLPPSIAPLQVVILPVGKAQGVLLETCEKLKAQLQNIRFRDAPLRVDTDTREMRGGEKYWSWVKKGVPLILELGLKELEKKTVSLKVRTEANKLELPLETFCETLEGQLQALQTQLYQKAEKLRESRSYQASDLATLLEQLNKKGGGFCAAYFKGTREEEAELAASHQITARCLPYENREERGTCFLTGKPKARKVLFARAY